MSFQTRSDFGNNRCSECLGLRFSPTEPIKHFPDCSQHPANLIKAKRLRSGWTAGDIRVRAYCDCGDAAQANGKCQLCTAEFWDPEHVEGRTDA